LTKALLESLERHYLEMDRQGAGIILKRWKENSDMLGRKVAVTQNGKTIQGIASDVNDDGSLFLRTDSGDIDIVSGDISVRY
jgi:biotin-(acetyl-CoA carboxylase) ligase